MIKPDKSWTLFLDRDGVINKELPADYVKTWDEFTFEPGALEAIKILSGIFGIVVIVTNQRGVGAGLMTEDDLKLIHQKMSAEIKNAGGRIDHIFYCTDKDRESLQRKPHPFMGHQAQLKFPRIDFERSVMVGNTASDMQFGKNLDMYTVFIDDKKKSEGVRDNDMDEIYDSLYHYAKHLTGN